MGSRSLAPYPPADAAQGFQAAPEALIAAVEADSPADDAGFTPGCCIVGVNGRPLRDMIDWQWQTADDAIELEYIDTEGDRGFVELEREEGEPWGFSFDTVVFDGVRRCRNACTFCFMRQLPSGMRPTLYVRDDDYRLSFLGGTFVTLTNVNPEDEARIMEQHISPLRVSLQASNPEVRRRLIGAHAAHGLQVFDRLLAAGIEAHVQIVLVPGENDGAVLQETLEWAYERPGILNVGIVPLGYTRHQRIFTRSFNETDQALEVIRDVEVFQARALVQRGFPWVYLADEFFVNAYGAQVLEQLPPADFYVGFELFEDGIGMLRSFADDWREACESGAADVCAKAARRAGKTIRFICGFALRFALDALLAESPLRDCFVPLYVENRFFGGNVDVTGLLCGCDIASAVAFEAASCPDALFVLPDVVFNDDALTLDDMTLEDMEKAAGVPLAVVSCNASDFLVQIAGLLA